MQNIIFVVSFAIMRKILVSWIGDKDLKAPELSKSNSPEEIRVGPIVRAIKKFNYDKVFLLEDYTHTNRSEAVKNYIKWFVSEVNIEPKVLSVDLDNPTNYQRIHDICCKRLEEIYKEEGSKIDLTFHLSPGTSQMHTVWVILSQTLYQNVKLIQSSKEAGVQEVKIPFEMSVRSLSTLISKQDRALVQFPKRKPSSAVSFDDIIGESEAINQAKALAMRNARSTYPVLIQGKSGTGKELFAAAIHNASPRSKYKFVPVNCSAIPESLFEAEFFGSSKGAYTGAEKNRIGFFEKANKGPLFLDEVGELSPLAQAKLLRVLQEEEFYRLGETEPTKIDVRIISATNRDLIKEISENKFREDLFFRLAVLEVEIPALSERGSDIELLIKELFKKEVQEKGKELGLEHKYFSDDAINLLQKHPWPGNIRELQSVLRKLAVYSPQPEIGVEDVKKTLKNLAKYEKEITSPFMPPMPPMPPMPQPLAKPLGKQEIIMELAAYYLRQAIEQEQNKFATDDQKEVTSPLSNRNAPEYMLAEVARYYLKQAITITYGDELFYEQEEKEILNRSLGNGFSIEEVVSEVARHYLARALEQTHNNKTEAAKLVGLGSYQSFTNWMNQHSEKKKPE